MVLQARSESSQVCKEALRAVRGSTEVSRVCAEHTLAIERLASQGKSFSWITKVVHRASMDEVAAKLPRRQLRGSGAGRAQASSWNRSRRTPLTKKHLLLKTGEVKWCWRCGNGTVGKDRTQWRSSCVFLARQRAASHQLCGYRATDQHPSLMMSGTSGMRVTAVCFSVSASCRGLDCFSCVYFVRTLVRHVLKQKAHATHNHTNTQTRK